MVAKLCLGRCGSELVDVANDGDLVSYLGREGQFQSSLDSPRFVTDGYGISFLV